MIPRCPKRTFLFITLIFAIIGVISIFKYSTTSLASKFIRSRQEEKENIVYAPPVDLPIEDDPTERVHLGGWITVICWPSVGGIIIYWHVSSVELDFLHLSRFERSLPSSDPAEEDMFCRQLRRTGGKWWDSYTSYDRAVVVKMSPISAKEREALVLGWPEHGGVWVLRESNWDDLSHRGWGWRNAYTMEERCKAMEMSGAVYYANPEDCAPVKALLDGFGEHEREPEDHYYYDNPADRYREL